jgi:hypothetical protein
MDASCRARVVTLDTYLVVHVRDIRMVRYHGWAHDHHVIMTCVTSDPIRVSASPRVW